VDACAKAVCLNEQKALATCMGKAKCGDMDACSSCQGQVTDYRICWNQALADPSDVGGCYSGSRACWADPVCPSP
jgi:hypothetical protein